jgi:transcriptional regulator GlxA family with amidase domain
MLTLIANAHGQALAERVSNGLVHRPHRAGSERQLPERPNEITREHALLRKVTSYMENRIEDPEKIDKISNMFGLTQRKLENLFSQHLNVLPSAYYLNLRLTHAREYLFYSGMSVKEIALACGFSSAAVFCRAFRRFHRLSPRQYRRQVSAETLKQFSNSYDPGAGPQILSAWHDLHSAAPSLGDQQRRRITPPPRADRR